MTEKETETKNKFEEARQIAQRCINLETKRKEANDELKIAKEELLAFLQDNPTVDRMFEFQNGIVFVETKTSYKIPEGLKQETELKSKHPQEISPEFLQENFVPDVKLSKLGKKRIKDESSELLSVLINETKEKIKITIV